MVVSVEYFDHEQREALCLTDEQWRFMTQPWRKGASRAGTAAHKIVEESKRQAA